MLMIDLFLFIAVTQIKFGSVVYFTLRFENTRVKSIYFKLLGMYRLFPFSPSQFFNLPYFQWYTDAKHHLKNHVTDGR